MTLRKKLPTNQTIKHQKKQIQATNNRQTHLETLRSKQREIWSARLVARSGAVLNVRVCELVCHGTFCS
jgi:hypothetical protein